MLWANEISVEILESNLFFIAARINLGPRAQPWLLFAVYGDYSDAANSFIWGKLSQYISQSDIPVCALGDFNCVTGQQEKAGGNPVFKAKNKRFRAFLQQSGLVDLGHSALAFTWANNQGGKTLILERLDHRVATADWVNLFPNSKNFHLPNYSSDHLPILLRTEPIPKMKVRPFRVEQWWS